MPRVRRQSKRRRSRIDPALWYLLADLPVPEEHRTDYDWCRIATSPAALRETWTEHRAEILALWERERPGCRPQLWWTFDAPRMPLVMRERFGWVGTYFEHDLPEPRRQVGGKRATPQYEVLAVVPDFDHGAPFRFIEPADCDFYNRRGEFAHVEDRSSATREPFDAEPLDPDDPPVFESEADYLARHGLLTPVERKALGR
jgi:hypothetical protein